MTTLVWIRSDLRLTDNAALYEACKNSEDVIPVYVWDNGHDWCDGGASRWWLHHSLEAFGKSLENIGGKLYLAQGDPVDVLTKLAVEHHCGQVFWNRHYEPRAAELEQKLADALKAKNIEAKRCEGNMLTDPDKVRTQSGNPFLVFSPFWRYVQKNIHVDHPLPIIKKCPAPKDGPKSLALNDLKFKPTIPWDKQMAAYWVPGEAGAMEELKRFTKDGLEDYLDDRNAPNVDGTSRMSPYLHHGEISIRVVWHHVHDALKKNHSSTLTTNVDGYLRQLCWREFSIHLIVNRPETLTKALRGDFEAFPWKNDPAHLKAWQTGHTGYPIVDAGMRQLWALGWMHNRVRLLTGSFLVKDLLMPWQKGSQWFWDTLVDADMANNTMGWQWVSGCGADAAPYFRIFNSITQSQKFDPSGDYIRQWVPELAKLPDKYIHDPASAPADVLKQAGVALGKTYPEPIVNHAKQRDEALDGFHRITKAARERKMKNT